MRRRARGALLALLCGAALLSAPTHAASTSAKATVDAVGAVGITVSDLARSIAFYRDVLSFTLVKEEEGMGAPLEQLEGVFGAHVR